MTNARSRLGSGGSSARSSAAQRRPSSRWLWTGALFGALTAQCGADDESAASANGVGSPDPGAYQGSTDRNDSEDVSYGPSAGSGGASSETPMQPSLPPEEEIESSFEAPIVTGKYLWSANPTSGRVALVDADTFEVKTLEAGSGPHVLAAIPAAREDRHAAIVLNELSQDATLFVVDEGVPREPETFPVHANANAWAISPTGRWAVAWTDAAKITSPDPTEGFQDLTLLHLDAGKGGPAGATRHTVGYRPASVSYAADEERFYVVTQDGISVIDLTSDPPAVTELIAVSDDPVEDPTQREVVLAPSGNVALVRWNQRAELGVVSLEGGPGTNVGLSGPPTDLDLSADGSTAIAVIRDRNEVVVLSADGSWSDPELETVTIPGLFGSISLAEDASVGVLYTNAVPSSVVATLSLAGEDFLEYRTADLQAPVQGIYVAEDAAHAIALVTPPAGSTKRGGFSIIPTRARRAAKLVGTDAPTSAVAIAPGPESTAALVTVTDAQRHGVYVVQLPSLQVDLLPLASPPLATGIIAELNKGFVAQSHAEGRITFIDFPSREEVEEGSAPVPAARTLTGFELAAKVTYPTFERQ